MNKRKTTLVAIFALLGIVALGLAGVVYAKYIASLTKSGSAQVAKWAFSNENQSGNFTCELTGSYIDGAIREKENENDSDIIAPGTTGKCTVKLSNKESDVAVAYTITVDTAGSSVPTNLKLVGENNALVELANFSKTGVLALDAEDEEIVINWEWPYETGSVVTTGAIVDDQYSGDTVDNGDAGTNMTLSFNIQGIQQKPTNN